MRCLGAVLISISLVFSRQWACGRHYEWQAALNPFNNLPLLLHQYQTILLGDRGTQVCTTCPESLHSSEQATWWSQVWHTQLQHTPLHTPHTHTRLTALCPGLHRWAGTRKVKLIWILLKQETVSGSGIRWDICKSTPHSRQITMPAPHRSVLYRPDALPVDQPTVSKHWRQSILNLRH